MSDLVYPTLDLFVYDLRNGLGDTEARLRENQRCFQQKLPEGVQNSLFDSEPAFDAEYIELLKERYVSFTGDRNSLAIEGYYYPVRLGDTYGLLLDCSIDNKTQAQSVQSIAALKSEIDARLKEETSTIGQTWMLSGWLPPHSNKPLEELAQDCYCALFPQANWEEDLQAQGHFLGAAIFELWQFQIALKEPSPRSISDVYENRHLVIVFYPDQETAKNQARFYSDWMRLFGYRNKVLWAYGQSRWLAREIKRSLTVTKNELETLQVSHLSKLDLAKVERTFLRVQTTVTDYTSSLISLDFQSHTLEINLGN